MVKKHSGKILLIPLEFNLGFTIGRLMDFTDFSSFNGNVMYVYNYFFRDLSAIPSFAELEKAAILFGPMCINKKPGERGKNSWKLLGQLKIKNTKPPVFKRTDHPRSIVFATDWSKIKGWRLYYDFNYTSKKVFDFEKVRKIETDYLYDKRDVAIRATMHYLILNKKNVEEYYDLAEERLRFIYLPMVNTSFEKKETLKLLKSIKPLNYSDQI